MTTSARSDAAESVAPDADTSRRSRSDRTGEKDSTDGPGAPTRLFLVRHAVTSETGPKLTGRMPGVDLSPDGVSQAEAVAARLRPFTFAAIYASPIERTMQTARRIAAPHGLAVEPCDGLLEADYGDWTGGQISELAKTDEWKVVQAAPSRARFPNGETIRAMQARIVGTLDDLVHRHRQTAIVVVSHADPIKSAIAHFNGVHLDLFQRIQVSPASVSVVDVHPFGAMIQKVNDTGSLDDLTPRDTESDPASGSDDEVP